MILDLQRQLNRRLLERIHLIEETLGTGKNIPDYAAYREKVGERKGLMRALQEIDELVRKYGEDENDDTD